MVWTTDSTIIEADLMDAVKKAALAKLAEESRRLLNDWAIAQEQELLTDNPLVTYARPPSVYDETKTVVVPEHAAWPVGTRPTTIKEIGEARINAIRHVRQRILAMERLSGWFGDLYDLIDDYQTSDESRLAQRMLESSIKEWINKVRSEAGLFDEPVVEDQAHDAEGQEV